MDWLGTAALAVRAIVALVLLTLGALVLRHGVVRTTWLRCPAARRSSTHRGGNGRRRHALSIKMISGLDVYRAANLLIDRYGEGALIEAAQMLDLGDMDGRLVWWRIRRAIEAFQASPSGRVH